MDIRSAVRNLIPIGVVEASKEDRRTAGAGEREPDGRREGDADGRRRKLSDDEIEAAVQALKSHPAVAENGLGVRLEAVEGIRVVLIEDRDGKVVRRIPEADLSRVVDPSPEARGVLLNRAG